MSWENLGYEPHAVAAAMREYNEGAIKEGLDELGRVLSADGMPPAFIAMMQEETATRLRAACEVEIAKATRSLQH